jgi:DNA-binding transcriptional LysR family regulator
MDLKRLRTFIAVVEEKGFARAAERLALAQPAVSKHVKDLEEEFGGPLLERRPDGVRLTFAGDLLLNGERSLVSAAAELDARVKAAAHGDVGLLTLGFNETVSWGTVIPKAIYEFRRRHPNVTLTMHPMLSVDQLEALRARRIDGGFLFHRDPADPELRGISVLENRLLLAVPRRSRWAKHPPARLADLADEPFIWIPRNSAPVYYDRVSLTAGRLGCCQRSCRRERTGPLSWPWWQSGWASASCPHLRGTDVPRMWSSSLSPISLFS